MAFKVWGDAKDGKEAVEQVYIPFVRAEKLRQRAASSE